MVDVNELLDFAIVETEKLFNGEMFLVKDLFKGYEWKNELYKFKKMWIK